MHFELICIKVYFWIEFNPVWHQIIAFSSPINMFQYQIDLNSMKEMISMTLGENLIWAW